MEIRRSGKTKHHDKWISLNDLAAWVLKMGFATGHADTVDSLLAELEGQIDDLRGRLTDAENGLQYGDEIK